MSSEEAYALYYDLLYSHRDVAREVDFLERVFSQCSQVSVRRVLDVGCGTGIHSIELARRGYEVLGVDLSQKMIEVAREKSRAAEVTGVYFLQADATRLEFEEEFDAAIAMYGVISYFTRDENLLEFLRSLRRALKRAPTSRPLGRPSPRPPALGCGGCSGCHGLRRCATACAAARGLTASSAPRAGSASASGHGP